MRASAALCSLDLACCTARHGTGHGGHGPWHGMARGMAHGMARHGTARRGPWQRLGSTPCRSPLYCTKRHGLGREEALEGENRHDRVTDPVVVLLPSANKSTCQYPNTPIRTFLQCSRSFLRKVFTVCRRHRAARVFAGLSPCGQVRRAQGQDKSVLLALRTVFREPTHCRNQDTDVSFYEHVLGKGKITPSRASWGPNP